MTPTAQTVPAIVMLTNVWANKKSAPKMEIAQPKQTRGATCSPIVVNGNAQLMLTVPVVYVISIPISVLLVWNAITMPIVRALLKRDVIRSPKNASGAVPAMLIALTVHVI